LPSFSQNQNILNQVIEKKRNTGWWYTYPSEKYEFVSWGYYSQLNGKIKAMFQTTNQKYQFNLLAGSTWYLPHSL